MSENIMNLISFLIYHAKFYILWAPEVTSILILQAIKLQLLLLLLFCE